MRVLSHLSLCSPSWGGGQEEFIDSSISRLIELRRAFASAVARASRAFALVERAARAFSPSHHLTISPSHHLTPERAHPRAFRRLFTFSPFPLFTPSPPHHLTIYNIKT